MDWTSSEYYTFTDHPIMKGGHVRYDRHIDKKYLEWIRKQPCMKCGKKAEPHHCWSCGGGNKLNDYLAIPLCRTCHMEAHRGEESWQRKTGIYYETAIIRMNIKYIRDNHE